MLTPQEVSEHAFAKASFGGYNMAMVDEFLERDNADAASFLLRQKYSPLFSSSSIRSPKISTL